MKSGTLDDTVFSPAYYNEYPIPEDLVKSFFVRLTILIAYSVFFLAVTTIAIFSLLHYLNPLPTKTMDLFFISLLFALIIDLYSIRFGKSSLPKYALLKLCNLFGISTKDLKELDIFTFAALPIKKWIEKTLDVPTVAGN